MTKGTEALWGKGGGRAQTVIVKKTTGFLRLKTELLFKKTEKNPRPATAAAATKEKDRFLRGIKFAFEFKFVL